MACSLFGKRPWCNTNSDLQLMGEWSISSHVIYVKFDCFNHEMTSELSLGRPAPSAISNRCVSFVIWLLCKSHKLYSWFMAVNAFWQYFSNASSKKKCRVIPPIPLWVCWLLCNTNLQTNIFMPPVFQDLIGKAQIAQIIRTFPIFCLDTTRASLRV